MSPDVAVALGIIFLSTTVICFACVLAGSTRPVIPGLVAGAAALAAGIVGVFFYDHHRISPALLFAYVGVSFSTVFPALLWYFHKKQAASHPIPEKVRVWLFGAGVVSLLFALGEPEKLLGIIVMAPLFSLFLMALGYVAVGTNRFMKASLVTGAVFTFLFWVLSVFFGVELTMKSVLPGMIAFPQLGVLALLSYAAFGQRAAGAPAVVEMRCCAVLLLLSPVAVFLLSGAVSSFILVLVGVLFLVGCTACAIMGNTRSLMPCLMTGGCMLAVFFMRSMIFVDLSIVWFLVLILVLLPICLFILFLWYSVYSKRETYTIPNRIRVLILSPVLVNVILMAADLL